MNTYLPGVRESVGLSVHCFSGSAQQLVASFEGVDTGINESFIGHSTLRVDCGIYQQAHCRLNHADDAGQFLGAAFWQRYKRKDVLRRPQVEQVKSTANLHQCRWWFGAQFPIAGGAQRMANVLANMSQINNLRVKGCCRYSRDRHLMLFAPARFCSCQADGANERSYGADGCDPVGPFCCPQMARRIRCFTPWDPSCKCEPSQDEHTKSCSNSCHHFKSAHLILIENWLNNNMSDIGGGK